MMNSPTCAMVQLFYCLAIVFCDKRKGSVAAFGSIKRVSFTISTSSKSTRKMPSKEQYQNRQKSQILMNIKGSKTSIDSSSKWWGRGRLPQKIPDLTSDNDNDNTNIDKTPQKQQQQNKQRKRRRKSENQPTFYNHPIPNLPVSFYDGDSNNTTTFFESWNYTSSEIQKLYQDFPPLTQHDKFPIERNLLPKMRFLVEAIQNDNNNNNNAANHPLAASEFLKNTIPAKYFGSRLEKALLPKHAYLMFHSNHLPCGSQLLASSKSNTDISLFEEFLNACSGSSTAQFASLCNKWQQQHQHTQQQQESDEQGPPIQRHTVQGIESFERLFRKGLLSTIRDYDEMDNDTNEIMCTSEDMVKILLNHGADPLYVSGHGGYDKTSFLHWAAGVGNVGATRVILDALLSSSSSTSKQDNPERRNERRRKDVLDLLVSLKGAKDGATPIHWACCGVNADGFGCGGHVDICRLFLEGDLFNDPPATDNNVENRKRHLANVATVTGNTPLMWACWSGSLDVVKLLLKNGADPNQVNHNGCTIAHWCCSGGHLDVCKYLHYEHGIDFIMKNEAGHTPLNHAITYGRPDVVRWIISTFYSRGENDHTNIEDGYDKVVGIGVGKGTIGKSRRDTGMNDGSEDLREEEELAKSFANWVQGDETRIAVLDAFENM